MNARTLFVIQFACIITMVCTANALFAELFQTILFALAIFIFIQCSIYISRNEKWLLREEEKQDS